LAGTALNALGDRLAAHPVDVQLAPDLPPVYVDATLVVQVLVNLLDNVIKYTPPGTRVHLSATVEGAFARLTLDDEGPGLPPGDPRRLFNKFQRGNEEGSVVGVGLGLAICRAIVRAHGGDIEAGTRPGGGARFELTLPITDRPAP
jgi:two-component system sensor histidine kinase KdpD